MTEASDIAISTSSSHTSAAQQSALEVLRSVFGYETFRPPQDEVVANLIGGDDALVIMPTGGGKSLCFQIPAIVREGCGIVVSPLIALMHDQVTTLKQAGVKAVCLNSSMSFEEIQNTEARFLRGELDLLYVSPERLLQERTQDLFSRGQVALFAIDEAHCVSQWGHDFRPEYRQLNVLHLRFPMVPRVALTATADAPTRQEIVERLGLEGAHQYISGFDRPNIRYHIQHNPGSGAREQLLRFIRQQHPGEAGIVYCLSRKKVEDVARWLAQQGLTALPYHAGLDADERAHNQARFINEEGVIVVATIAFGMGIDKPNVRFVAHLNLPKSIEAYYQETGRAGRDGLASDAWMIYGLQDVITLRQMMDSSNAADQYKRLERKKLDAMLALCETTRCRRAALLKYFGDELEKDCGNCDICSQAPETWDATVAAQKALSCVHRTGQRFGVTYLIDVLLGKTDERMKRFGHQRISTFAIGLEHSASEWRSVYRQLIARGYLDVDIDGHGGLRLNASCKSVLKGEETVRLRRESKPQRKSRNKQTAAQLFNSPEEQKLWEALRSCRRRLSQEQGVPPYVIFHDATLMEMVAVRPTSLNELSSISGVGERKLEAYGDEFVATILEFESGEVGEA